MTESTPLGAAPVRRSLILAGGGMKVGYQAGVLQVLLDEAGLGFDHADGTSGGCLNLAMVQSGLSGTRIADNWRTTGPFELTSLQPWYRYLLPWRLPSMLTFDRLRRQLPVWGVDFAKIRSSPIAGTYNLFDFSAKQPVVVPGTAMTEELFPASFALPVWFPSVRVQGTTYIDGVYWKDANLTEAVRRGADEIWVIWTVSDTPETDSGAYHQYFDIIEAVADGRFYEELREIERINEAVRAGTDTAHREITVHVIRHAAPVPLDYLLFFSAGDMARIVDMGVRDARRYLSTHGVPFTPSGPLGPTTGIRFVERMAGHWAPGETDPRAGERRGRATGSTLAVRLAIAVDDMDRFLDDPERVAVARPGRVDCPALGGSLRVEDGTFNVLRPAGEGRYEMRYTLRFADGQGTPHVLVGVKHVADDAGFDAWADTTTLFVRVHRGTDESGPVVGAGVLYLGITDLVRQMGTFRVFGGRDIVNRLFALAGFGRFFVGALWATYVRRRSS